jgi:hypothetical protein
MLHAYHSSIWMRESVLQVDEIFKVMALRRHHFLQNDTSSYSKYALDGKYSASTGCEM